VSRFLTTLQHIIGYSVLYKLLSRINFTYDMSGNVIKYNYVRSRLLSYDKISVIDRTRPRPRPVSVRL